MKPETKKTKIIATVGPSSDSSFKIKTLIESGVDVFRFNTKHSTIEWHNERIKKVQKIAEKTGKNIGIMIDLQGNEIRIETKDQKNLRVKKGSELIIGNSFSSEDISAVISDENIFKKIKARDKILVDDGSIELEAISVKNSFLKVLVLEGGLIKHRKSVNFPGTAIKLPSLIEKDIKNLDAAAKNNINFVALSFVNSKQDIRILKKEMEKRGMSAGIISKIENQQAIQNIDEIINESDAVMIARGDLGIEIPIESLAFWQKEIIRKCRESRKPVIVATQMLYSMVKNSRPTRAEATDVANAVFDGTDAVMLSEETALGKNPVRAVNEMVKILKFNEKKAKLPDLQKKYHNPAEFVVGAVARELEERRALKKLKIRTAIVFTESGYTSTVLSSFRPNIKIVAVIGNKKVVEKASLSYGVIPYYAPLKFDNLKLPSDITSNLKKSGLVSKNEIVAVFHGRHNKKPNLLNLFSLTKVQ